jgi:Replication protein
VKARPDASPSLRSFPAQPGSPQQVPAAKRRRTAPQGPPREVAEEWDHSARRSQLWSVLRFLRTITTNPRQQTCRHHPHGQFAEVRKRLDKAHWSGLVTCGLVWTCPLCGIKIAAERAADICAAITTHYSAGGQVALLTFTLRHSRSDSLSPLLDGLTGAWRTATRSRLPRALLAAYSVGWIKRVEITVGRNGWHPHLHVLVFLNAGVTADDLERLAVAMASAWEGRLVRDGFGTIDREHGVTWKLLKLGAAHELVSDYVAKAGALELANPGTKLARATSSRTPLQLLADLQEGARNGLDGGPQKRDRALWAEYEAATRRRQMMRWSKGLRALLVPELGDELTDEEAAAAGDGLGRLLLLLDRDAYRNVRLIEREAQVLSWAEVYDDDDEARDCIRRQLDAYGLVAGISYPPTCEATTGEGPPG